MRRCSPIARRRALVSVLPVLLGTVVTVVTGAAVAVRSLDAREVTPSMAHDPDTLGPRRQLRSAIADFETAWRTEWTKAEYARHSRLDTKGIGRDNDASTGRVRRFWAMRCILTTPGTAIEPFTPPVVRHPIVSKPDRGAVCPMWLPPGDGIPPDEGESIDLALPAAEQKKMYALRETLIATLEKAHAEFPLDAWIAGQRVRFIYDQRDTARTRAAAEDCRGNALTCAQLLGLAHFQAFDWVAAEIAFRTADSIELAMRKPDAPCINSDDVMLFSGSERAYLTDQKCDRQQQLMQTGWWLSDPMWSVPGNERYVMHGARRIHATLRAVNDRDERYVWTPYGGGDAIRDLVVRYGWPSYTYWPGREYESSMARSMAAIAPILSHPPLTMGGSRARAPRPRVDRATRPLRVAYFPFTAKEYSPDRTALLPDFNAIRNPFTLSPSDYSLVNPNPRDPDGWWPNEHVDLRLKIALLDSGQTAMFRRDSSITWQMAIDDPLGSSDVAASRTALASLWGGSSANDTRELARAPVASGFTLRLHTPLASAPIVLSAEIAPRTSMEAAQRLRFGLRPPPTLREMKPTDVALSVPVFLRLPNRNMPLPVDEAGVLRYMAGGLTFPRNEILGLYWESYGLAADDTVQIELRIRRDDNRSAARIVGSVLGVASALRDSISIKWTEPDGRRSSTTLAASKPVVGRSIALDVNALAPGTYVAIIEMRNGAQAPVRSERRFVLTEP